LQREPTLRLGPRALGRVGAACDPVYARHFECYTVEGKGWR